MPTAVPFREPFAIIRRGKHVVDLRSLVQWRRSIAPTDLISTDELLSELPNSVRSIPIESSTDCPSLDYTYIGDEAAYERTWPAGPCRPTTILEIQNGSTCGRQCFPMCPMGRPLVEFAFNLESENIEQSWRLGRLDPRYKRYRRRGDLTARKRLPQLQHFDGSVAVLNSYAAHNYYHWMTDVMPRLEALQRAGVHPDKYLVDAYTSFQLQTLRALGVTPDQIIQPHNGLHLRANQLYTVPRGNPDGRRRVGPWLLRQFNSAHQQQHDFAAEAPERIYIRRAESTSRRVTNGADLEEALRERGFTCIQPETLDVAGQARAFSNAKVIVALHGAGLANTIYAPSGAAILELMPRGRVNLCYPLLSQSLRHRHWIVTVDRTGRRQHVVVPTELICSVIDSLEHQPTDVAA